MHAYIHTCMHTACIRMMHTNTRTYVHAYKYIRTHTHMHTYTYACWAGVQRPPSTYVPRCAQVRLNRSCRHNKHWKAGRGSLPRGRGRVQPGVGGVGWGETKRGWFPFLIWKIEVFTAHKWYPFDAMAWNARSSLKDIHFYVISKKKVDVHVYANSPDHQIIAYRYTS